MSLSSFKRVLRGRSIVISFFFRGANERRSCETRLSLDGTGYELVIADAADSHIERFRELRTLLFREHQLLTAWRALGWQIAGHGAQNGDADSEHVSQIAGGPACPSC